MNAGKIKLLLVEDEALNFNHVKQFLQREGYEVLSLPGKEMIDNFDDAVLACQQEIPHIAILDIRIKGEKDGLDIAAYIRDNFYSPVIMLSSHDSEEYFRRAAIIGVEGYVIKVEKPFNEKQLRADIRRLLPFAEEAAKKRTESFFLSVRPYIKGNNNDGFYLRKRIDLGRLLSIAINDQAKNSILLLMSNGDAFEHRSSLTEFGALLPYYFLRFSNREILNARFFDGKGKKSWIYYIGSKRYEVAETYRTEELLSTLNRICS